MTLEPAKRRRRLSPRMRLVLARVVVVVGSAIFILGRTHGDRRRWEFAFMLAALVAFVGLVQFPFGAGIYFLYVAPLVGLAAVAVAGRSRTHDDPLTVAAIGRANKARQKSLT